MPISDSVARLRRRLAALGASLFFIGLLTGLWAGLSLTRRTHLAFPRLALAAHLNAIFGGLWLIAVAWTLEFLHHGRRARLWMVVLVSVSAWANWLVTLVASLLDVRGLDFGHGAANDAIAALLQGLVVAPALVGAALWVWGFVRRAPE